MIIVSQMNNGITESLEFEIIERKTTKNEIIPKEIWDKFKKITQKSDEDNTMSLKELKGIGELLGKDMTRTVYMVVEIKSGRNFGTYTTKEKAMKTIDEILKAIKNQITYKMPNDKELGFTMI